MYNGLLVKSKVYQSCLRSYLKHSVRYSLGSVSTVQNRKLIHTTHIPLLKQQQQQQKKKNNNNNSAKQLKELSFVIPNYISLNNLSNLIGVKYEILEKKLIKLGFTKISSSYILTREYIELVLQEFQYEIPDTASSSSFSNTSGGGALASESCYDKLKVPIQPKNLVRRAPIVTIMGHVDHGKTTLLDYWRHSSIVDKEHGGITQHIGAFKVVAPVSKQEIVFLDTPGHEAFLKMRERGALMTDIIVLCVSIDDSVKPQTLEALKHIKKYFHMSDYTAGDGDNNEIVPLIIAVTKIDRYKNNPQEFQKKLAQVENDLIVQGIPIEKIGGDVPVVPISGKTGENMAGLEEQIVFTSELLDLKAESSPNCLEGYIIESSKEVLLGGITTTVLIRRGQLKKGQIILCGSTYCKIRTIKDENGLELTNEIIQPGNAVQITGWKDLPNSGDPFLQIKSENLAKKYINLRENLKQEEYKNSQIEKINELKYAQLRERKTLEGKNKTEEAEDEDGNGNLPSETSGPLKVNFIIKGDVSGSVEAIRESIENIGNDEVHVNIVSSSVGAPTETDINLANISQARIVCFNLPAISNEIANNKYKIEILKFNVIYNLIEQVVEICSSYLKPIIQENKLATIELNQVMEYTVKKKAIKIAGCKILQGILKKSSLIKIMRMSAQGTEECVYRGKLASLKQGKIDATEMHKGQECGLTFQKFSDFKKDDSIIVYEINEIKRHL